MSKSKERKKVTDKKLNKELFVNFKVNADFLKDKKELSIKVDDPRLKILNILVQLLMGY